MKKRLLALFLCLTVLVAGCACLAPVKKAEAATYQTAAIVGGWLRLRRTASYDAETIASYQEGTLVTILSRTGDWCRVRTPDGQIGYMREEYLDISGSGQPIADNQTRVKIYSSTGKKVNMRSAPSTASDVVAVLENNTQVTLVSEGTNWSQIKIKGMTGYVMNKNLDMDSPVSSYKKVWVTSSNGYGVRLRTGASKSYPIIGVYSVGTVAYVINQGTTWSYISIGSRTGYMMTEFLATRKPVTPTATPSGTNAYIYASNGLPVCLRMGPGKNYSIIASYESGTAARIISEGETWDYIQVGSTFGYMMSRYLTRTKPISGQLMVYVSDGKPFVGETLHANVTPADATVNYRWYDGADNLLGTSESLLVTNAMKGKTIYVRVTGTGYYSGTAESAFTSPVKASDPVLTKVTKCKLKVRNNAALDVGEKLVAKVTPSDAAVTYEWHRDDKPSQVIGTSSTYTVKEADRGHRIFCVVSGISEQGYTGNATSDYSDVVPKKKSKETATPEPEEEDTVDMFSIPIEKIKHNDKS